MGPLAPQGLVVEDQVAAGLPDQPLDCPEVKVGVQHLVGKEKHLKLLPPFPKSRNALPQSTVTPSLESFLRMTTRCPVSTKGLHRVCCARAHGH